MTTVVTSARSSPRAISHRRLRAVRSAVHGVHSVHRRASADSIAPHMGVAASCTSRELQVRIAVRRESSPVGVRYDVAVGPVGSSGWRGPCRAAPAVLNSTASARGQALGSTASPGLVSRAEIIDATRASDCRVVGVTAPAGYGKTTLLAQWALSRIVGSAGCPWTATTTTRRFCSRAGLGLRSGLAGQRRPGRRHGRPVRGCVGTCRAPPRRGLQVEPGAVRAHGGRPSRAPRVGLS